MVDIQNKGRIEYIKMINKGYTMESEKKLERITRVQRNYIPRKNKKGTRLGGPYWFGYYQKDGKTVQMYIGKELPQALRYLVKKRYRKPGHRNYTWPKPRSLKINQET